MAFERWTADGATRVRIDSDGWMLIEVVDGSEVVSSTCVADFEGGALEIADIIRDGAKELPE